MSKTHSLPGKVPYSGPSKFSEICRAIVVDAENAGIKLSYDFVYRVIRLFFGKIFRGMRYGQYISIPGFGDFALTKEEKKKRILKDDLIAKKSYIKYMQKKKLLKLRKAKHTRLDVINSRRATIDLKPLTIDEFIHITKKRKPRKLITKSKFNYTFEILDMLETSK